MKLLLFFLLITSSVFGKEMIRGMNLTELGEFRYDAARAGQPKTDAQVAVDQIYDLGARHIVLNPIATMDNPKGNVVTPRTSLTERPQERRRYLNLIRYIKSKGMTVGLRPIFFVVKPDGSFPYIDESGKLWWHGNIQPSDPNQWFESFKAYLDSYILIAKIGRVEEFTIGAELYSMTVGIEDQWQEFPYGFPGKWLELLRYVRSKLNPNVRIMYDANFTDDAVSNDGDLRAQGGELERWRYRLVDLANPQDPKEFEIWQNLVDFWNELDAIGIDMYRSLASQTDDIAVGFDALSAQLEVRAQQYALQLDTTLAEIEFTTGKVQTMIFKEVGFRSVENGFINPFEYEDQQGVYNEVHQAAAYEALKRAFWDPQFYWFQGASFWDVSVNPRRNTGVGDTGFSPVGKPFTTSIVRSIYAVENPNLQ